MLKAVIISPYFVAFILGGAAGLCLPPINSFILTLIILIAFFYGFLRFAPKKPAFYAYNFALGFFLTGLYWIGNALLVEGNDYKWAWPFAVFALPAGLALFYALSATLTLKLLGKDASPFSRLICFTQSIMIAELARSFLFTGFPWNLLGTTWSNFLPTIQLASVIGLLGMTWLILIISAFIGFGLYTPIKRQRFIALSLACVLCAGNILFGYITLQNAPVKNPPSIHVITVQPNIPQSEKWNPLYAKKNMEKLVQTSEDAIRYAPDKTLPILLVWPETALSYHSTEQDNFFPDLMAQLTENQKYDVSLITGALTREINRAERKYNYQNAALYIDKNGKNIHQYVKTHLVPFGEYIPFQKLIPLKTVTGFNGFQKGNGSEIFTVGNGLKFMPKICYEIIFPNEMTLNESPWDAQAQHKNAIIHVTNDGWYGNSPGPYQHQSIALIRAIENNALVFRAANKGISAIISPQGRVLAKANLENKGAAAASISLDNSNASFYTRLGLWVVMLLTCLPLLAIIVLNGYKKA
tara:strand:- start:598 stop:2175 length:1578 start_codon:yes stop_codon:yes gene_type:complete